MWSMADAKALLWLDLETTGSNVEKDEIIEIGAMLSDFELQLIGGPYSAVCHPSLASYDRMMNNDVVRQMHQSNGLIDELNTSLGVVDLPVAESELVGWIRMSIPKGRLMLAGSGVSHFDSRFIKAYLPSLYKILCRPCLDVGTVRRFFRLAGDAAFFEPSEPKDHRAVRDVLLHLSEARHYRSLLMEGVHG